MRQDDFRRILIAFADKEADVEISRGNLLAQIRNEVITAKLSMADGGELFVEENDDVLPANTWIINRIARIPLLAERIIEHVSPLNDFVPPTGNLLDQLEYIEKNDDAQLGDAMSLVKKVMGRQTVGTTSVLYLTSDAGEGKTTLINRLAREQAANYKAKKSTWLFVPIPLGGRTFLRFDDVVIAALVNRLRFQLFYYEAFLELVRMGVLIPAFDGFEEMMIEGSTGEAISALGNLVKNLESAGAVLIAARTAYFDYQSFRAQARLFDAIGQDSASFGRLALDRWTRSQFIAYAVMHKVKDPDQLYQSVADHLGAEHPLLTRAVLVRKLIDIAETQESISRLISTIDQSKQDYLFQFVNALVEREANEKWIDKIGDPPHPLLSIEEHHELLALVAQEQWLSGVDALKPEVVGLLAEIFAESKGKSPTMTRQISERLKQHALLVATGSSFSTLAFDHEDFRYFYLGEALGLALSRSQEADIRELLKRASLPNSSVDEAVLYCRRKNLNIRGLLNRLQMLSNQEIASSFVRENCGALSFALVDANKVEDISLVGMSFQSDCLKGKELKRVAFQGCYFQPTSLVGTRLAGCTFDECRFERLEIQDPVDVDGATLSHCTVDSIFSKENDEQWFDPTQINRILVSLGFQMSLDDNPTADIPEPDEEMKLVEKVLRIFLRSTQASDATFRVKLGTWTNYFIADVLPRLIDAGIIQEIEHRGGGLQRRFKLAVPMRKLQDALQASGGKFDDFTRYFK